MLHNRHGDAERIRFLKRIFADIGRRNLAAQENRRRRVHEGVGNRRDEVGRARPGRADAATDFAGRAGVAFGHVTCALFVARENAPDFFLLSQCIVNRQNRAAGNAEQHVHAFAFQSF